MTRLWWRCRRYLWQLHPPKNRANEGLVWRALASLKIIKVISSILLQARDCSKPTITKWFVHLKTARWEKRPSLYGFDTNSLRNMYCLTRISCAIWYKFQGCGEETSASTLKTTRTTLENERWSCLKGCRAKWRWRNWRRRMDCLRRCYEFRVAKKHTSQPPVLCAYDTYALAVAVVTCCDCPFLTCGAPASRKWSGRVNASRAHLKIWWKYPERRGNTRVTRWWDRQKPVSLTW